MVRLAWAMRGPRFAVSTFFAACPTLRNVLFRRLPSTFSWLAVAGGDCVFGVGVPVISACMGHVVLVLFVMVGVE